MYLTRYEQEMLAGKHGYPVQKSMEILVGLGECYDARRMVPITSAHVLYNTGFIRQAGTEFLRGLAEKGGKFVVFTDTNPSSIDYQSWPEMGIPTAIAKEQTALAKAVAGMGGSLSDTCTPYFVGHTPLMGQHVAWNESSAVIFANSVLGARTNREGGPSAFAAALAGRVPEYGFHLDENRRGQLKIVVTARLRDPSDYGTLGFFAGGVADDKVPVITGIRAPVSLDELKLLGLGAANAGSVTMFHIVGTTPEAPTEEAAFGGKKAGLKVVEFGEKEKRDTEASLNTGGDRRVDFVTIGCPHASIQEIREIARLIDGKKVKSGVEFWVSTSRMMDAYADRMGYARTIRDAGARIICGVCARSVSWTFTRERGFRTLATNATKMANGGKLGGHETYYGSMERCVAAAVSGIWR